MTFAKRAPGLECSLSSALWVCLIYSRGNCTPSLKHLKIHPATASLVHTPPSKAIIINDGARRARYTLLAQA